MEGDFGAYLQSVAERDVDLLLMEEFHVSPDFVSWFAGQVGFNRATFDGAWHSVSDGDGETDLLLRVVVDGKRTAILIENKVAAAEQDRQDQRYHIRGARSRDAGLYETYITCICAPSAYLAGLSEGSLYDRRIPYEAVRDWYKRFEDSRSVWRSRIMTEAIDHSRRGYNMIANGKTTTFHMDYWNNLRSKHTQLTMVEPKAKGSSSNWIILKTNDIRKGVTIDHKLGLGCVDLSFNRTRIDDLLAVRAEWPEDIAPLQVGGSAVLRKIVPRLDMDRPLADQLDRFEQVLATALQLAEFRHILRPK